MVFKTHIGLHIKYPFFFQILMKLEFSPQNFENYSMPNLMKIHPDMTMLTVAFRNFANVPKNPRILLPVNFSISIHIFESILYNENQLMVFGFPVVVIVLLC